MDWGDRKEPSPKVGPRSHGDIDYARIVHSASFRRLQGKTQVFNFGDSDFYRTRLTHSVEVAQLAGSLAVQFADQHRDTPAGALLHDRSMIQAIGYTHDLGHPPFGHGGEVALNYCMRDNGGFEGNGQTLRILTKLEKFSATAGANLSRRTLLGVLKYPVPYSVAFNDELRPQLRNDVTAIRVIDRDLCKPPKCYLDTEGDAVGWILEILSQEDRDRLCTIEMQPGKHNKARFKSLDCSIMDLADDISFGVHDIEDAIALGVLDEGDFRRYLTEDSASAFTSYLVKKYPNEYGNSAYEKWIGALYGNGDQRKHLISRMVAHLMSSAYLEDDEHFSEPLLKYRATLPDDVEIYLKSLKDCVYERVVSAPEVQHLEFKGQNLVVAVFEALASEPNKFLPAEARERIGQGDDPVRAICDHVAGMTDSYLLKIYGRLFSPGFGSVFDRL